MTVASHTGFQTVRDIVYAPNAKRTAELNESSLNVMSLSSIWSELSGTTCCKAAGCDFTVEEETYTCIVHKTTHVCDATCECTTFSATGATFVCPISGKSKSKGDVKFKKSTAAVQLAPKEHVDERCKVANILELVMRDAPEEDREALAYEIARVRPAYSEYAHASTQAHTLALLFYMAGEFDWVNGSTVVIPKDKVVRNYYSPHDETNQTDVTRGISYIRKAINACKNKDTKRRRVSFETCDKHIPDTMILRPRELVKKELHSHYNAFVPSKQNELVISVTFPKKTKFTY